MFSFIRTGSGDQRASEFEINALYRDQSFGVRSEIPVEGTSINNLHKPSIETFRNRVRTQNPQLPYNDLNDDDFLEKLGVLKNGLVTYGGLLVLGNEDTIRYNFTDFWVDYLEIPAKTQGEAEPRYTFRIQEQENLWEYYNVLIQRLRNYADNPFRMGDNGFAYEDNTQFEALREGLVNMLMHADYFSIMHSTIRVFTNRIVFQNAGRFGIDIKEPAKVAISKPRNPVIARFFRWAKLAENAGFGFDKMLKWKYKVNFQSYIDFSETTFYLENENISEQDKDYTETQKTVQKNDENYIENYTENARKRQKTPENNQKTTRKQPENNRKKIRI